MNYRNKNKTSSYYPDERYSLMTFFHPFNKSEFDPNSHSPPLPFSSSLPLSSLSHFIPLPLLSLSHFLPLPLSSPSHFIPLPLSSLSHLRPFPSSSPLYLLYFPPVPITFVFLLKDLNKGLGDILTVEEN